MAILAREVRERCSGKCDPQVLYVLEALAEQQSVMRQQMLMLAQSVNQMTDIIGQFTVVAQNMKDTVDSMKGMESNDSGPDVTV